jgi:hypothetical protein
MHEKLSADQYLSLVLIFGFMILTFACWKFPIFLPFKLLTVFMHEMGHAITGTFPWCLYLSLYSMDVLFESDIDYCTGE